MSGIVINIDPVIVHLGALELRWYSLAVMLAVLAAVFITARLATRKGINPQDIYSLSVWVIAAGIIGARAFHVIDQFSYYSSHPAQILQFQQGGLAIWGALGGGAVAAVIFARVKRIPLGPLFDALAPALLVAQIIGRFGCIVNGDAYGGVTSLPWAFIYVNPNALIPASLFNVPTHPYPVYEQIWNAVTLLIIWRLARHYRRDGMVFLTYLSLYSVGRFLLTFVREERVWFWGLQEAQVIALVTLTASLITLVFLLVRQPLPDRVPEQR